MGAIQPITVPSLTHDEQSALSELMAQLDGKLPRNLLRAAYYDGKNAVKDLGISTPPNFQRIATVLGWSAKAVDILNRRCNLDGVRIPGIEDVDSVGVGQLWRDNYLDTEASQAGVSSLIHSTAFLLRHQGDTESGEPAVLITARDALTGTGMWDRRRRCLRSFLSIIDTNESGRPTEMVMYLPGVIITMTWVGPQWRVDRRPHDYGVPVEPLVYQPRLGRPFGSSRISRAVMSLHDSALRTVIRSEVTAELYSVGQRVLLGADERAFLNADGTVKSMWQAVLGRIWAIGRDEDGNMPQIADYPAASQQPHMDQLRSFAQLFAGETSIPLASLGISGDANPTSSEAYDAGRDDLIHEAEGVTDGWTPAWRRTMLGALQMLNGWDEIPAEMHKLQLTWRSPAAPSRAAAADAGAKQLAAVPWLAETEVGLELLGLDKTQIQRALADKRRVQGRAAMQALISAGQPDAVPV